MLLNNTKNLKTPLRYPGGKSKSIKYISPLIPDYDEYREPFIGGASVFIHLKQTYPNKIYWINDLYSSLYIFWNELKTHPMEVILQINEWKNEYKNNEKQMFKYAIENLDSPDGVKAGAAFYVINKTSFSGLSSSGSFSQQAVTQNFTDNCINKLDSISKVLGNTTITNLDYSELINKPGKNVFLFLDPPYFLGKKSNLYGKNGDMHKNFNHELFAETIKKCPHKWLITYNDCPEIRELFNAPGITIQSWEVGYTMHIHHNENKQQKSKEIFIYNYDLNNAKSWF